MFIFRPSACLMSLLRQVARPVRLCLALLSALSTDRVLLLFGQWNIIHISIAHKAG